MSTASDRDAQLKSARQKLKSFRAKKHGSVASRSASISKRASIISEPKSTPPVSPAKRLSFSKAHAHKRTASRASIIALPVAPISPAPSANPMTHNKRRSRHSRTDSILSPQAMKTFVTSPNPAEAGMSSWSFPRAANGPTSVPMSSSPSASSRFSRRQSQPQAQCPPPAASAATGASRRASLQFPPSPLPEAPASVVMTREVSTSSTASQSQANRHSRRPSKHSRQVSVSTRRESMDIMSGLIASGSIQSSNPAYLAAHGSPDFLKGPGGASPTFPYPASPRSPHVAQEESRDTERESALSALEGRITPKSDEEDQQMVAEEEPVFSAPTSLANKRASWGNAASAMALQGGKGAECLGMLVEEEEDEEEDDAVRDLPSPTVSPTKRQRPASLFIPLSARSINATIATPDAFSPGFAKRPLSLSTAPSTADSKAQKQQRRQSGLRSLTLGASTSSETTSSLSMSSSSTSFSPQKRSSVSTSSPGLARSTSSNSVASTRSGNRRSSIVNKRPSISTSISYKGLNGLSQPQQGYNFADTDCSAGFGSLVMEDMTEKMPVNDEKERLLTAQLTALHAETYQLQEELSAARAELAVRQAESDRDFTDLQSRTVEETRSLHLRVFELEGSVSSKSAEIDSLKSEAAQLASEIEELKESVADAVAERDEMGEDVEGWRQRCADLEKSVERERTKFDEERKEGLLAREKLRKLGDRLAANNNSNGSSTEDQALASAQAKLIGEMRDQIFSLAGALEREQREHRSAQSLLQQMDQERTQQHHPGNGRSHNRSDSSTSSVGGFNSSNGGDFTDDTSFCASENNSIYGSSSFGSMSCSDLTLPAPTPTSGGLHTLAEEEEEDTDGSPEIGVDAEAGWTDAEEEEDAVPELDFQDTETDPSVARAKQSTQSSVDETMPKTPVRESPDPASMHRRSDSFIKQWTFPKGPVVEPLHIVIPDDHCFFSLSSAQSLPPLPLTPLALEMPPFFSSDLVVDEDEARKSFDSIHSRRPSSPRPSISPIRSSFALKGPPPSRSARVSATLNSSPSGSLAIAPTAMPQSKMSRMSLQGISSLITSTFASVPASAGAVGMASAAANLCHAREDSVFAEDHQALLAFEEPAPAPKADLSRPYASPLHLLDFTRSFGVPRSKVIRV